MQVHSICIVYEYKKIIYIDLFCLFKVKLLTLLFNKKILKMSIGKNTVRSVSQPEINWNLIDKYCEENYLKVSSFFQMIVDKFFEDEKIKKQSQENLLLEKKNNS